MDSPRFISFPKISLDEKERYDPFYSRTRFLEGLPSRSQKWITSQHSFHFQTRFLAVVDTPRIAFVIRSPRRGSNPQKDPPLPFFLFFFGIVFPPPPPPSFDRERPPRRTWWIFATRTFMRSHPLDPPVELIIQLGNSRWLGFLELCGSLRRGPSYRASFYGLLLLLLPVPSSIYAPGINRFEEGARSISLLAVDVEAIFEDRRMPAHRI